MGCKKYCHRAAHLRRLFLDETLRYVLACLAINLSSLAVSSATETIALWLFDEPRSTYPSSVLDSSSEHDYPLVLGQGGKLVAGKFGNALATSELHPINYPAGDSEFGLKPAWEVFATNKRKMTWHNAHFTALMSDDQRHLRKEVGMVNAVETQLNLGEFDWTVEFWFRPSKISSGIAREDGTVFELGLPSEEGPGLKTRLVLSADRQHFLFVNDPSLSSLNIATDGAAFSEKEKSWHHLAFVHSAARQQISHYVDGQLQPLPHKCKLKSLPARPFSYLSLGRNGSWEQPLPGHLDELRFSAGEIYQEPFQPPKSLAPTRPKVTLKQGFPLLFDKPSSSVAPLALGSRKHLFIDDALLAEVKDAQFVVNPPRRAERVVDGIQGPFRKHLTVVDDPAQIIRIYNSVENDHLAVRVSRDGIHFAAPAVADQSGETSRSAKTHEVVIPEMVGGLGNPFIDPNGPKRSRWKYFSDYHRRGIYLYTSPDGYSWQRNKTATLPFRSGTQSCTFYDDQRQIYVAYHRSGIHHTLAGGTERSSVVTEHKDLAEPLEFAPVSQQEYLVRQSEKRLRSPLPWYLDNGPLTPGGFGLEFPHAFRPVAEDPVGTDIYVTKAQKYPWAHDTYVAFPVVYFHYWPDGPSTRHALAHPTRGRGSGPVETQLAVSRDGRNWQRYPRPAYVSIGRHGGRNNFTAYIAHGMVRRGDEIWQYYFGETQYHSTYRSDHAGRGVYRLVQRLDGFVSLDSPYDSEAVVVTKPFTFSGNRLVLNIDTDAAGYAQVGILDEEGKLVPGFSLDECVYVNGDFIETKVEWLEKGKDLGQLAGKTIQLVLRMRGCKLYALQFVDR